MTSQYTEKQKDDHRFAWMGIIIALLVLVSSATSFPMGTWQWWVQILLLGGFGWSLVRIRVSVREFMMWNVFALIPHALLAIQQGVIQEVFGTKWLGIASQIPETRGVAVVEAGGIRHLRAYGGMPYPNILGGWLVLGLPGSLWLAQVVSDRYKQVLWLVTGMVFVVALILTHSRSAWIATGMMTAMLAYQYRPKKITKILPIVLALCITIYWQWPWLSTRVTGEGRLEARSVTERISSVQTGLTVFFEHPWLGIGPGAFTKTDSQYIIPHNIFLLALAEVGIVGVAGIGTIIVLAFHTLPREKRKRVLIIIPLLTIAMVDHYLWSYWSGQSLVALSIIWIYLEPEIIDKKVKN